MKLSARQRWLFSQYLWHTRQAEHYREQLALERGASRISAPLFRNKGGEDERRVQGGDDVAGMG